MSPETSRDETTSPKTGVRRLPCTRANCLGNSLSSAAARETRAVSMIQPFRAPNPLMNANSASRLAPKAVQKLLSMAQGRPALTTSPTSRRAPP